MAWPVTSGGKAVPFWLHLDSSTISSGTIATEAARRGLVVFNAWESSYISQFKAVNPNIQCYVYKDLSSARTGDPTSGEYAGGIGMTPSNITTNHPTWRLLSGGVWTAWSGFPGSFPCDIGVAGYQSAWGSAVLADLQANGWDGVFADNALVSRTAYGENPDAYATDALFQSAYQSMLAAVGPTITNGGFGFIPNVSSARLTSGLWDNYTAHMTGGFDEHWVVTSSGGGQELGEFGSPSQGLVAQITEVGDLETGSKHGVVQSWSGAADSDDPQGWRYSLAAFFLTSGGHSLFSEVPSGGSYGPVPPWRTEYAWDLGAPQGAYTTVATKVYVRQFAQGLTVVNGNTSGSATLVNLGGTYLDMNGNLVSSISIAPLNGMVFRSPVSGAGSSTGFPVWHPGQVLTSSDLATWMRPLAGYKVGTSSQSSNTVLAADPDLTITFPTAGVWAIEGLLRFNGPASNNLAFGFVYNGTVKGAFSTLFVNSGGNNDLRQRPWNFTGTLAQTTGVTNEQILRFSGTAAAPATSFSVAWAQGTASATATSMDAGSYLKAWRIA